MNLRAHVTKTPDGHYFFYQPGTGRIIMGENPWPEDHIKCFSCKRPGCQKELLRHGVKVPYSRTRTFYCNGCFPKLRWNLYERFWVVYMLSKHFTDVPKDVWEMIADMAFLKKSEKHKIK